MKESFGEKYIWNKKLDKGDEREEKRNRKSWGEKCRKNGKK